MTYVLIERDGQGDTLVLTFLPTWDQEECFTYMRHLSTIRWPRYVACGGTHRLVLVEDGRPR